MESDFGDLDLENEVCAARGCGNTPQLILEWLNPNLQTKRRKFWAVCARHEADFRSYLEGRGISAVARPWPL